MTLYYKFAIDAMEEVRISPSPLTVPRWKFAGFVGIACLWTVGMMGLSYAVHPSVVNKFIKVDRENYNYRRVVSIILSYFIVAMFLRYFMMTMYRVQAMLNKGIWYIFHYKITYSNCT